MGTDPQRKPFSCRAIWFDHYNMCILWILSNIFDEIFHYIKYAKIRVFTDPHSVLMRENTGQWKSVLSHILCSVFAKMVNVTIFAKKIFIIGVWQVSKYAPVQHCWWLQLKATTQRRQNRRDISDPYPNFMILEQKTRIYVF